MKSNRLCDKDVSLLSKLKKENKELKEKVSKLQKVVDRVQHKTEEEVALKKQQKIAELKLIMKRDSVDMDAVQKKAENLYYAEVLPVT